MQPASGLRLAGLLRYPVKSMAGEPLIQATLTPYGLAGDRLYAFESPKAPPGMLRVSGRERRQLLAYHAHNQTVTTPEGITLLIASPELLEHLRTQLGSPALTLTHALCPQTDCRPLSLLSLQTIAQLSQELVTLVDLLRFRPNLLLDLPNAPGFHEDTLVGRTLQIGSTARIQILERDPRCRLITFNPADPQSPPDVALIQHLHRHHQSRAGVYAQVLTPGKIQAGDPILSIDPQ